MGEVYLARDETLDRPVALKFLPAHGASPEQVERFLKEVRAVASLNHPNIVHVYDAGDQGGMPYLAMERVDGESLRSRLLRGPVPIREALRIAREAASALAAAHSAGVVHRDVKPENLMLRRDHNVKLLDFGLAKLLAAPETVRSAPAHAVTEPGMVVGTAGYMSPEQVRGLPVDGRTDIFSLAAVLYEMVTGERAFTGEAPGDALIAVLLSDPAPIRSKMPDAPAELDALIFRALQKDAVRRFETASEFAEALLGLEEELRFQERLKGASSSQSTAPHVPPPEPSTVTAILSEGLKSLSGKRLTRRIAVLIGLLCGCLLAVLVWVYVRAQRRAEARGQIPMVEQLARAERFTEAFLLAKRIEEGAGPDESLREGMRLASSELSVKSDPPDAQVFVALFDRNRPDALEKQLVGTTPVAGHLIAKGEYILFVEKEGFLPFQKTFSCLPVKVPAGPVTLPLPAFSVLLKEPETAIRNMVLVPGGPYALAGWERPDSRLEMLDGFFIDRTEVRNSEFLEFVQAGGYHRPEFWKHRILREGKPVSLEEALGSFRDLSGLAGPRQWQAQTYPQGQGDLPVTGVTWYEAAAYAEFRGKALPSIFQWDKAARDGLVGYYGSVMPWGILLPGTEVSGRANLAGARGLMPVDSLPFAMSAYGCRHMAGNAAEWCANPAGDDEFFVTGGAWDEPAYQFGRWGVYPGLFSSPKTGFRCVRGAGEKPRDGSERKVEVDREALVLPQFPAGEFARAMRRYAYPKVDLAPRVVERVQGGGFMMEKIVLGGKGREEIIAYLYLPERRAGPVHVIHYLPSGDVSAGYRSLRDAMEQTLLPLVRSGRAAFGVTLPGYPERTRPANYARPGRDSEAYAGEVVSDITDLRRGLDYLETRPEIDRGKLAFAGVSAGANLGMVLCAVDGRYASLFFHAAGAARSNLATPPAANSALFAPRLLAPKLMFNGRYDEVFPVESSAQPLFALMPDPKRVVFYDGGHTVPLPEFVKVLSEWLDESLGKVR
jgi:formylglycine-generating enzyme required for sulfatase activity/predicted esterase